MFVVATVFDYGLQRDMSPWSSSVKNVLEKINVSDNNTHPNCADDNSGTRDCRKQAIYIYTGMMSMREKYRPMKSCGNKDGRKRTFTSLG